MQDFVARLIKNNSEQYGSDGVHFYQNARIFVNFVVSGNGKEFDILEFKRITHY
jgi:hypothetical protein